MLTDRFVFMPSRHPEGNWTPPRALAIEDVHLTSGDGTALHAWYARPAHARATLLFLHGNAGNITHRLHLLIPLLELPVAVFLLDYRGYGRSAGTPSEHGVYADAQAAYQWLLSHGVAPNRLILYGESLGGAVAVETAGRVPAAGLIVQSSFTSMPDMARRVTGLPLGFLLRTRMRSIDKVRTLTLPKLFLHGEADELVPYAMGQALYAAAAEPRRFVGLPDVGHNDWPGARTQEWLSAVSAFLQEHVHD